MATNVTVKGESVVLVLSRMEAEGLLALAGEGVEGILTDKQAAKGYIGGKRRVWAAQDAYDALQEAVSIFRNPVDNPK